MLKIPASRREQRKKKAAPQQPQKKPSRNQILRGTIRTKYNRYLAIMYRIADLNRLIEAHRQLIKAEANQMKELGEGPDRLLRRKISFEGQRMTLDRAKELSTSLPETMARMKRELSYG